MISLAKQKNPPFEAILVWKLSDLQETGKIQYFINHCLRKKVYKLFQLMSKLMIHPAGKMLEGILEVVDEFYSNNLASDTMRGMKENASRGFHNGGNIPFGYIPKKINVRWK